ncbi:MAG: GNAT family N-acetyltransferase [Chloroflexi bacterium]|nr:GNAT family N-acetyltransferase [Chloroflexota bacterium]
MVAIYNAAIPGHEATADLTPVTVEEREAWFAGHEPGRRPLWLAAVGGEVIGWISRSTFYARRAWDPTVAVSLYVRPDRQRQGVGRALLNHALAAALGLGISSILAVVFAHNHVSLALLESAGFQRWGHLPRVTHMPEGRRDVVFLGREL